KHPCGHGAGWPCMSTGTGPAAAGRPWRCDHETETADRCGWSRCLVSGCVVDCVAVVPAAGKGILMARVPKHQRVEAFRLGGTSPDPVGGREAEIEARMVAFKAYEHALNERVTVTEAINAVADAVVA